MFARFGGARLVVLVLQVQILVALIYAASGAIIAATGLPGVFSFWLLGFFGIAVSAWTFYRWSEGLRPIW